MIPFRLFECDKNVIFCAIHFGTIFSCFHEGKKFLSRSQEYIERAQMLVTNENLLLQTLGFDVNVVHPHTHVVKYCQLLKTQKDLAHTSYFMATNRYYKALGRT